MSSCYDMKSSNLCIFTINTDLGDHGVIVDADVTSLLDAAVNTDLTGKGLNSGFRLSGRRFFVFVQQTKS